MEKNKEYDDILKNYGPRAGFSGRGWGGCQCPCHSCMLTHIQSCCHPSTEELTAMLQALADDKVACKAIHAALLMALGNPFGAIAFAVTELPKIHIRSRGGGIPREPALASVGLIQFQYCSMRLRFGESVGVEKWCGSVSSNPI